MKVFGAVELYRHSFLISELETGYRSTSGMAPLPWGKTPGMHRIGCWTGPRASLEFSEKKKVLHLSGIKPIA
jgi:hypothetical protein